MQVQLLHCTQIIERCLGILCEPTFSGRVSHRSGVPPLSAAVALANSLLRMSVPQV